MLYLVKTRSPSSILTFPIVEVEFDGFALVNVKIREPNGKHKQNKQQKEFKLLADFLQRKAHPLTVTSPTQWKIQTGALLC